MYLYHIYESKKYPSLRNKHNLNLACPMYIGETNFLHSLITCHDNFIFHLLYEVDTDKKKTRC